jgi:hypothetical protein
MKDKRSADKIFVGNLKKRQRRRWKVNIETDITVTGMRVQIGLS